MGCAQCLHRKSHLVVCVCVRACVCGLEDLLRKTDDSAAVFSNRRGGAEHRRCLSVREFLEVHY
jgi:hypothetical protein